MRFLKRQIHKFFAKYFYLRPNKGLRLFYRLKIDIWFYALPLFIVTNRKILGKLWGLKLRGYNPKVIICHREFDGRFMRVREIANSPDNNGSIWFEISPQNLAVYDVIFYDYLMDPKGFYDDARMKYIEPSNNERREIYKKHMHKIISAIEFLSGKISFFMCGSNNDTHIVELITAFQERGASCIVCEREGTGTPYTYVGEAKCFKASKSIQAHYIFTANDDHRKMFDYAKLPSVRSVETLGELDTDWWFHGKPDLSLPEYTEWNRFSKKVLFLTFGLRNYLEPYLFPDYPDLSWKDLLTDVEGSILTFAEKNPDTLVFYRMGHAEDHNQLFLNRAKKLGLKNIYPSTRSFPCGDLIRYCDLIIGFQTTAIFEAMFTDKPIFFLNWNIPSVLDPQLHLLPILKYNAVHSMNSKDEFDRHLGRWSENPNFYHSTGDMMINRKKTREIMFWEADGHVAERLLKRVNELIEEKNKEKPKR